MTTPTSTPTRLPYFVSYNGALLLPEDATISVRSPTLYGAYGVYESIQLWNGHFFHLPDHLARLEESAALIELPLAGDQATVTRWIQELHEALVEALGAQEVARGMVRLFALLENGDETQPATFLWLEPPRILPPEAYEQGVGAVTYQGERAIPRSKSLNMLVNTLARKRARAAGEHEGLLVDRDGNVREGSSSNFFVVQGETLLLPPVGEILDGVTQQIVLRLAEQAGIPVERRPLPLAERGRWDEAFLTSTSRHVLPLVRLDGQPIAAGRPGPITQELHRRFEAYFEQAVGEDGLRE